MAITREASFRTQVIDLLGKMAREAREIQDRVIGDDDPYSVGYASGSIDSLAFTTMDLERILRDHDPNTTQEVM